MHCGQSAAPAPALPSPPSHGKAVLRHLLLPGHCCPVGGEARARDAASFPAARGFLETRSTPTVRARRARTHSVGARGSGRVSVPAHQCEPWEWCAAEAGGRRGDAHARRAQAGRPRCVGHHGGTPPPRWGPATARALALRPRAHLNAYCTQWGGACQRHFHFTHKEIKVRELQPLARPGLKPRRFVSASGSPGQGGLFMFTLVYIRPRRSCCVYPLAPHCRRGTEAQ